MEISLDTKGILLEEMGDGNYAFIHQHIRHFLGRRINKMNRECVEICLLIKAGTAVTNKKATSSDNLNAWMLKKYMFIRTYQLGSA
jgi:hypothetical protein